MLVWGRMLICVSEYILFWLRIMLVPLRVVNAWWTAAGAGAAVRRLGVRRPATVTNRETRLRTPHYVGF